MTDAKGANDPTLVERWLQEQQEWQRTLLAYVDSMVKNDDFLVNLGNAMRGSLLAGKPYPTAAAGSPSQTDERLDKVLFALNMLQGQLQDLFASVEELRKTVASVQPQPTPARAQTAAPARPPKAARKNRPKARRQTTSRTKKARA